MKGHKVDIGHLIQALFPTLDVTNPQDIERIIQAIRGHPEEVNEAMRAVLRAGEGAHAPDDALEGVL